MKGPILIEGAAVAKTNNKEKRGEEGKAADGGYAFSFSFLLTLLLPLWFLFSFFPSAPCIASHFPNIVREREKGQKKKSAISQGENRGNSQGVESDEA